MSAVAPSREEQAEITRFGIFDEDMLSEMEEHADDHVPCAHPGCEAPARFRSVMTCCRAFATLCTPHTIWAVRVLAGWLTVGPVDCAHCGRVVQQGTPVTDALDVIPL